MKNLFAAAAVTAAFTLATPALAATALATPTTVAFGTHSMSTSGSVGNVIGSGTTADPYFKSADGKITASVTGWTTSGATGTPAKAYVADYSNWGLGVTNYVAASANGTPSDQHQIDNIAYFDFVAVKFSTAVTLNQLSLTTFNGYDTDYWVGYTNAADWSTNTSTWNAILGNGRNFDGNVGTQDGVAYTPTANPNVGNIAATTWLIGAARPSVNAGSDLFKLRSLSVTAAVPEPATWLTMILGFGIIGGALRRRRSTALAAA